MGTSTPNYSFYKPDLSDPVDVTTDLNANWDRADSHGHSGTYVPFGRFAVDITESPYSCDPTGVADATAGLQAALDSLGANGGNVYAPRGTYKLSSEVVIPQKVSLTGGGIFATTFLATSGFTGTRMFRLGPGSVIFELDMVLEHLLIDCNDVAGLSAIYSNTSQETAYLRHLRIRRYRAFGIWHGAAGGFQASHVYIDSVQLFPSSSGSTAGIAFDDCANSCWVLRSTVNATNQAGTHVNGIYINDAQVTLIDPHIENYVDGIEVNAGSGGKGGATIIGATGISTCTNLIHNVDSANVVVIGARGLGSPNVLVDDLTGFSTTSSVVEYSSGRTVSGAGIRLPNTKTLAGVDTGGTLRDIIVPKSDNSVAVRSMNDGAGVQFEDRSGNVLFHVVPSNNTTKTPIDVEFTSSSFGVVLLSPNSTKYRLSVDNSGVITTTAI